MSQDQLLSQESWLIDSRKTHNNYYDYSSVNYHGLKHRGFLLQPSSGLY